MSWYGKPKRTITQSGPCGQLFQGTLIGSTNDSSLANEVGRAISSVSPDTVEVRDQHGNVIKSYWQGVETPDIIKGWN